MKIKVLWVDDQEFEPMEDIADAQGIDITHVYSWAQAEPLLADYHFDDWSAIIFDCYCTMQPNGPEDERFLQKAFARFNQIRGSKRIIPWYILSAGAGSNFETIISFTPYEERLLWDADWEKVYYSKNTGDYKTLLERIKVMAPNLVNYKTRYRFREVFDALENTTLFDERIASIMYSILKSLLYPQDSDSFNATMYYNQLRKCIEYIFRSCNKIGLLPDELITKETGVNLSWSYHYLIGNKVNGLNIRYGESGERIVPDKIGKEIDRILLFSNINSHTSDLSDEEKVIVDKYFSGTTGEYVLYSMALGLCSVILWYEEYVKNGHDNIEENRRMCRNITTAAEDVIPQEKQEEKGNAEEADDLIDKVFIVERDEHQNIHCGKCRMSYKHAKFIGKKVRIKNIQTNTNEHCKLIYPYYCNEFEVVD